MSEQRPTRKGSTPIYVWVLPEEKTAIESNARASGLSTSRYLRSMGLGYPVHGILDYQRVDDLARINGDLGRLGGLLKLWLTNDEKLAIYGRPQIQQTILGVLDAIKENQTAIRSTMAAVVTPLAAKKVQP